jgi:drug/metabolite transporter (DMT)-like permease
MDIIRKNNASFFLFLNAFLWGSSYVWSKMLLSFLPRFSILFICAFVGIISTLITFYPYIKAIKAKDIFFGLKISSISIVSNTFFMLALQYTSSSNTAFIVQLSVVITPMLMAISEKRIPSLRIIISAITALTGMFLLTCDFKTFRFSIGDLFALGNALFFSIYITRLNKYSSKVTPAHYTFIQHTTNAVVFFALAGVFEIRSIDFQNLKSAIFILLAAASIFISIATVLIQSLAIKYVRPEKATLIYTFEPVTALVLGTLFIGEKITGIKPIIGCLLILLSVVYSIFRKNVKHKSFNIDKVCNPILKRQTDS